MHPPLLTEPFNPVQKDESILNPPLILQIRKEKEEHKGRRNSHGSQEARACFSGFPGSNVVC